MAKATVPLYTYTDESKTFRIYIGNIIFTENSPTKISIAIVIQRTFLQTLPSDSQGTTQINLAVKFAGLTTPCLAPDDPNSAIYVDFLYSLFDRDRDLTHTKSLENVYTINASQTNLINLIGAQVQLFTQYSTEPFATEPIELD